MAANLYSRFTRSTNSDTRTKKIPPPCVKTAAVVSNAETTNFQRFVGPGEAKRYKTQSDKNGSVKFDKAAIENVVFSQKDRLNNNTLIGSR